MRAVANATGDAAGPLQLIAETTARLFGATSVSIRLAEGSEFTQEYRVGAVAKRVGSAFPPSNIKVGGRNLPGTVVAENRQIHIPDLDRLDPSMADFPGLPHARAGGARTMCGTPLRREGKAIGALIVFRDRLLPFTDDELSLQQSFADQAVIAIENARLFNETREALERQTATADILKVIASSPSDVQPVFDAILARALHLCEAAFGFLAIHDGERFDFAAQLGVPPALAEHFCAGMDQPRPGDAHWRLLDGEDLVHNLDQKDEDAYRSGNPLRRAVVDLGGARSALVVALRRSGSLRGSITIYRKEVRPFSASQIALLRHFADQAVVAIENTRLFNETQEALERQAATSDILRVISQSPTDVKPVFDAIVLTAVRLTGCDLAFFLRCDGATYSPMARATPEGLQTDARPSQPIDPDANFPSRAIIAKKTLHLPDWSLIDPPAYECWVRETFGIVSSLYLPLVCAGECIGLLVLAGKRTNIFGATEIALAESFRDQAVIAIENTRLFEEVQARTRDLQESLAHQIGSSNVLRVIASSPTDVEPVLKAIVESARELCEANDAVVLLRDADHLCFSAHSGPIPVTVDKWPISRNWTAGRAFVDQKPVHVHDMLSADGAEFPDARVMGHSTGAIIHTVLSVPLLRANESIGAILLRRTEVRPFNDKQVSLLSTFADQAVIAIGNVRLFDEVQAKTRDLSEALTYQTGSANILNVIASSPTDVAPVLEAIVESACEVCEAYDAAVLLRDGDHLRFSAHHGPIPIGLEKWPINRRWTAGRAFIDQQPVHIEDLRDERHADFSDGRELSLRMGHRTIASVPLLRDKESVGAIVLRRVEVHPFSDKQIALLQTFADQAVIALGNVRLFEEVQARTRDLTESLQFQTATSDVLKVISRSPDALQPVLDAIVETSRELCASDGATIFLLRDQNFYLTAVAGGVPKHLEYLQTTPASLDGVVTVFSRALELKRTVHYPNVFEDPYLDQERIRRGGPRALLVAPLMRDGEVLGVIVLRQSHLKPFTPRQIQAIETFADQAVIAISNVNLFEQVQQRTRELSRSLEDLRAAQDRLVQTEKLASLGQLTAGIAHEIKNPLNFVNNFSALSVELTDELKEVLKQASLVDRIRAEVDEITGLIKDNLGKVVQHGKRADSIVRNMLLHSREGVGDRRSADINTLVGESLNLAYHGARAEKPDFSIALKHDLDPNAGALELYPQEITRALLNLISNGFYAAARRKAESGDETFEPVLSAATRDLGETVEIRIRDNGTGISPEVRAKMFNPFFTTKPTGEGTGLGLSMTHDIIVKQHGGRIDVDTEPGAFTEFIVSLPRNNGMRAGGKPE